ncbi:glycoside hydrolase family 9 protein [Urechidicola croceus]|uniref:Glycoside hydrolase n=1 Tax=Urechidicola croceus TaxID=1850246 RepID=A0A1D8P6Z2_9FLAO|nr:glycoside hydrolase family 9 protein [Urechidicola croceus]AOW20349.1 glycoside hydrolase [Urechidicola croceus]
MKYLTLILILFCSSIYSQNLTLNDQNYFEKQGLNVTVFSDIYPDGHQTGVTIIQHGVRVAANGDLRLEISPGQWSPVPKGDTLMVDKLNQIVTQRLSYPDESKNRKGFNPIEYPDLNFSYNVSVSPLEGNSFKITVDLDKPLPNEWIGKVGFNMELFPGDLFGKSFLMDNLNGMFPIQPNGPITNYNNEYLAAPLAIGKKLIVAPEEDLQRIKFESTNTNLELWDGRTNHNNGWYIIRSTIPKGVSKNAIEWIITPNTVKNWKYKPVIQVSQLGYHNNQTKKIIIEQDKTDINTSELKIFKLTENGKELVNTGIPKSWGSFLRYNYLTYDFSEIKTSGMYVVEYRGQTTNPFKIDAKVFDRHVWQPVLEYYLPVQMCHMRVNEKYRVWHGLCHHDDALMAPTDTNHFDGYRSESSTLTKFEPYDAVPGLNVGGWHDAGDYDLRVESQIGTVRLLSLMVEEFGLDYDATLIDYPNKVVEIHVPDGKNDAIQQIEHGLQSILGGYRNLGRLYRGIICQDLRQYVMLGDGSTMTDNLIYDATLGKNEVTATTSGKLDDRLVFTEENPNRELFVSMGLATASRALKNTNSTLSQECIDVALVLYNNAKGKGKGKSSEITALAELIKTTQNPDLIKEFIALEDEIVKSINRTSWIVGQAMPYIKNKNFKQNINKAVSDFQIDLAKQATETPYGVPYRPNIWGAGWNIQRFGVEQYFLNKHFPSQISKDFYINALNFVLGVHPGENTSSFASGVGSKSVTVAYGVNRGDWSFIPGGVASGTALIRPDLPELKRWPFFWQQTEYVMGGGSTNYMFLVLATNELFKE